MQIQKINLEAKNLAPLLKSKREELSLSQNDIADMLEISRTTYLRYEQGVRVPTLECLINLSKIYCINIDEFIKILIPDKYAESIDEFININYTSDNGLSMFDRELLYHYNKLNKKQQKNLNSLLKSLF